MLGGRNLATTGPSRIVSASLLLFVAIVTFNTQACSACSCPYVTIKEQLCFSDWLAVVTVDVQVEELQLLAKTIADIEVGAVNEVLIIPLSNSSHSNNVNSCDLGPDDFIDGGTYVLAGKEENGTLSINMCYYHILWTDVDEADRQMFLDWNDSDYNEMCKDHCPPGCLEYFDGCNTCGCTFEGDLFDCSTAVCDEEQTVDPLCTCSATEPSSQCELECTAGFTTDLRGCAQCECIPDNNLAV
ncbi:hypothetical protein SARC_08453 [Sphaeroforma arctica JP610]|uniref:Antistasin-like domain-containing protein n=1 Tax=Sphaeroforma arctica JP610 TaxID=667725 RepID=A0A0L0FQV3_9EUKA|nr:hypothetical protein SARC_08453 [Sphaeroforma arctica JP610]KNC79145.1 hypothetical protein SARC_08453 [Sphaeroforma arctica JP610]|eukprot:XP_014153047.1 hypothetical protein SARC_08453 [Sphaeroforma arctica JP610]